MKPLSVQINSADEESTPHQTGSLSEINVIPLVDVVLVLLLIFMLTAPMLYRGIDVNVPKTSGRGQPSEMEERMILALTRGGKIYLNERKIPRDRIERELEQIFMNKKEKTLYFKADEGLSYGQVVEVMNRARNAGIEKIGMMTEAKE